MKKLSGKAGFLISKFNFYKEKHIVLYSQAAVVLDLIYAFYNGVLGVLNLSLWFISASVFYGIFVFMRFAVVLCGLKSKNMLYADMEYFVLKLTGILLIMLSILIAVIIYVNSVQSMAVKHSEIIMITIATYTFYKTTDVIIKYFSKNKIHSPLFSAIGSINYAQAAASVLNLQRSMLVSFGTESIYKINLMNSITGGIVCIFILLLGVYSTIKGIKKV